MLRFAVRVFNNQVKSGRYAHLGRPRNAKSWKTKAFADMLAGYHVDVDQCEYGLNVDGNGLNRKPTRIATNKRSMCALHAQCSGNRLHVPLMGGSRTRDAENYPQSLAESIARLMSSTEEPDEETYPVDDTWDMRTELPKTEEETEAKPEDRETFAGKGALDKIAALKVE